MDKIITSTPCSEGTLAAAIERYEKNPHNIELCRFLHREYSLRGMVRETREMKEWIDELEYEMDKPNLCLGMDTKQWTIIVSAVVVVFLCYIANGKGSNGGNPIASLIVFALIAAAGVFPLIWSFVRKSSSKIVVAIINALSLFGVLHIFSYAASTNKQFILYESNINNLIFGVLVFWAAALILAEATKTGEK